MSVEIIATWICDLCGVRETVRGGSPPEGWDNALDRYSGVTFMSDGSVKPAYCGDCIKAVDEAKKRAVEERRGLRREVTV